MAEVKDTKKRNTYWQRQEVLILLDAIDATYSTLVAKFSKDLTKRDKQKAWQEIAEK